MEQINKENRRVGMTNGMGDSKNSSVNHRPASGMTNGMTNRPASGMTNGMTNRLASGMTNGMTNGLGKPPQKSAYDRSDEIEYSLRKRTKNPKHTLSKILIGIFIVITLIALSFNTFFITREDSIDGNFDEWKNMTDIGFAKIEIKKDITSLSFGMERPDILKGNVKGNITEAYYIMINDMKSNDGFYLGYDTYEYFIDIYGINNKKVASTGHQFDKSRGQYDWSGFDTRYNTFNVKSANNNNFIEFNIRSSQLGKVNMNNLTCVIYHFNTYGDYEFSKILNTTLQLNKNIDNTRAISKNYYRQNFNTSELTIYTEEYMAYSSISYSIRKYIEPVKKPESNTNTTNNTNVTNNTSTANNTTTTTNTNNTIYEPKKIIKATKLTVEYEYGENDTVNQCGGILINSTVNTTITDFEFILYGINRTVINCTLSGDFDTIVIEDYTEYTKSIDSLTLYNSEPNPTPQGTISVIHAHGFNETRTLTLDGVVDDDAWSGAYTCQYIVDVDQDMKIFSQRSNTYLYIAIFYIETTIYTQDRASVYFDTWNAKNTSPNNSSYKRLAVDGSGTQTYYEGSGGGWALQTKPTGWLAYASQTNYAGTNYRTYEFQVPLSNLNEHGLFDNEDELIGFGVRCHDYKSNPPSAHSYYIWYPDAWQSTTSPSPSYINLPNTWSTLEYLGDFHQRDYALEVEQISETITIDGILNEASYSEDIGCSKIYTAHDIMIARIGYFRDTTYLYIGICVANWSSKTANDFAEVIFDTDYDQTQLPDAGDKRIQLQYDNTTVYLEGNGAGWTVTTTPTGWTGASAFTQTNSTWEFRVPLSDLDSNGKFGDDGEVIGFMAYTYRYSLDLNQRVAIYFPDGSQTYVSFIPTKDRPDLWGELVFIIPEYKQIIIPIFFILSSGVILIRNKKYNKNRVEVI